MDLRERTCEQIEEILALYPPFQANSSLIRMTASLIESSCNDANIDKARAKNIPQYWEEEAFVEQYSSTVYPILANLDPTSSVSHGWILMHRVWLSALLLTIPIQGPLARRALMNLAPINLKRIGYMGSYELNPHINQPILDEIQLRAAQGVEVKTTNIYFCTQCKQRKTTSHRGQTRSGDEGYTIFVECHVCGHSWRIY